MNLPSMSVITPLAPVLPPFMRTVAPMTGSPASSTTLPVTFTSPLVCRVSMLFRTVTSIVAAIRFLLEFPAKAT